MGYSLNSRHDIVDERESGNRRYARSPTLRMSSRRDYETASWVGTSTAVGYSVQRISLPYENNKKYKETMERVLPPVDLSRN